ncbi:MAG: Guanylate kinase [Candidatus Shapirobacteria bacterium GW2011_GWE1_38_10]|uniref:Guanylate kinase n=1 Tax=Candidatus Shapirobacteria bacterium GW2011_GWE1_38_10 TaxID=1618488 RepID=A0A0G0KLZ4_9BACT|nr:MAG: Guanylate kinase [Candidatus Shapirobacteria bacterium GW2011_GWF2_37_20]KKQ50199.1 MAG: Guanylate kinase [Candidatus Shapirobacteria bacterium GW2011_GWE1_38_10]KKQ63783.1 MAG: Guanylate kinase [Candidatus Shapirobacteria bacterium GW2011_GWF1_38_23]HBP50753.1 hypothetical protein [Candidatus Shapirobacteria bacterium]
MSGNIENKGLLIVLSGSSGVGKDVIMQRTIERQPSLKRVITYCADRGPRPGEIDGIHYHFISEDKFDEMILNGEFIEFNKTPGIIKGTARGDLEEALSGEKVIWRIDPDRASGVKNYLAQTGAENLVPLTRTIYLGVPTIRELWRRINERKSSESKEKRVKRLRFDWETWNEQRDRFDIMIMNETGKIEETVDQILEFIDKESKTACLPESRNLPFTNN